MVSVGTWMVTASEFGWVDPRGAAGQRQEKPLEKYDFDNLRSRRPEASEMVFLGKIKEVEERRKGGAAGKWETKKFKFKSQGKWISGMVNMPMTAESKKRPAVIMIRGYAEKEGYYTGSGSWRVADRLAEAGMITVGLDFLGFGDSDEEAMDMLEARFEKVPNVIDLIETVKKMETVDDEKIGIWAHSNGGQIALSVLEVTGGQYPTVLWAPMTNPFPQSVLETTADDPDSVVKKTVDKFLREYDARRYAFENYYQWVEAPVQIHQGTADQWCREEWQREVVDRLGQLGKEAELYVYEGDDHNLSENWEEAVEKSLEFFEDEL